MHLDMDDYHSVASFATALKSDIPTLHLFILNAGIAYLEHGYGPSGHERTIQVDYIPTALLICALLPLLESTARQTGQPSWITWVSSRRCRQPSMAGKKPVQPDLSVLGHLDDPASFFGLIRYGDNKLLGVIFMYELARRIRSDVVTVNAICLNLVYTDFTNFLPFHLRNPVNLIMAIRARYVEIGARLVINAAIGAGPESHGQFFGATDISP